MFNRLTKRFDRGDGVIEVSHFGHRYGRAFFPVKHDYDEYVMMLERLAAYEDTGLSPDEVAAAMRDGTYQQFQEWNRADFEGRLAVLLCKVGDTCYIAGNDGERIVESKINYITLSDDGIEYVLDSVCGENCDGCPFEDYHQDLDGEYYCSCEYGDVSVSASDFGKIVFLTREQAEAALAAGKEEQEAHNA